MRAALTATFERIIFEPRWSEVPEGAPLVSGPAELCPVLHSDLLGGNNTEQGRTGEGRTGPSPDPCSAA